MVLEAQMSLYWVQTQNGYQNLLAIFTHIVYMLISVNLKQLFTKLKFDVVIKEDVFKDQLFELLKAYSDDDHTVYDAFVCCILTHGGLGVIYTSDGEPIRILDITEYFSDAKCLSLTGKPKLFFIQACQDGESHHSSSTTANPYPIVWSSELTTFLQANGCVVKGLVQRPKGRRFDSWDYRLSV